MWTDNRLKTFIINLLRDGFRKYPTKHEVLKAASVGKKINKSSNRMAEHYKCNKCKKEFPYKDIQVDHVKPVIDVKQGFKTWDTYIKRLYCKKENLQVLCIPCHEIKTRKEQEKRK